MGKWAYDSAGGVATWVPWQIDADKISGRSVSTNAPNTNDVLAWNGSAWAPAAGGSGAPTTAQYVTLATDATLTNERVLTAGTGISLTDAGAGSTITVSTTVDPAPKDAQYVTLATNATLTNERTLAATAPITLTDGGAGSTVTIAASTFGAGSSGIVPASGGGTSNYLRADGTWAAPSGGADPWTYVKLSPDFTTSSATAVDVTGLSFTPAANQIYEIKGVFMLRTATATVGPRPGCAWPTGLTDGVVSFRLTSAAGTNVYQNGNFNAAVLSPVGGLPNTTQSWPALMFGMIHCGASPSGTFKIQLASETGGTNVTMKAQSWIAYRTI